MAKNMLRHVNVPESQINIRLRQIRDYFLENDVGRRPVYDGRGVMVFSRAETTCVFEERYGGIGYVILGGIPSSRDKIQGEVEKILTQNQ